MSFVDLNSRRRAETPPPFIREPLIEGNAFVRLITAHVQAQIRKCSLESVITDQWPNDRALNLIVRATSAPAMTTVSGWAAELAQKLVADGVTALSAMSAGAKVLGQGLVLNFSGASEISVPGFVAAAANAGFVQEGNPIPVRQLTSAAATLSPFKLASIAALTQEMAESSNAEALIGDALMRSAAMALDAVLFDANAATAARPAGLRYNIATLTASSATDLFEAFVQDMSALLAAVGAVGGDGPYCIVAAPGRAIGMALRAHGANDPVTVYGTPAVGNDIIAIACGALVSAFSQQPEIDAANAATLVMDDTAPATPDTTQPTKSMFQTATIAVKMRWPVTWALRDPRGVAWLTPAWK
jgi:hypothetical protein